MPRFLARIAEKITSVFDVWACKKETFGSLLHCFVEKPADFTPFRRGSWTFYNKFGRYGCVNSSMARELRSGMQTTKEEDMRYFLTTLSIMAFALLGTACDSEPDSPGEAIEEAGDEVEDALE